MLWWSVPQSTATSIWTRHPRRSRNRSIACRTCLHATSRYHVTTPLQVCAFALVTTAIMLWSVRKSTAGPIWIAASETRIRMRGEVATPHRALDDARRRGPGETFPVPTCRVFESALFSLPTGLFQAFSMQFSAGYLVQIHCTFLICRLGTVRVVGSQQWARFRLQRNLHL